MHTVYVNKEQLKEFTDLKQHARDHVQVDVVGIETVATSSAQWASQVGLPFTSISVGVKYNDLNNISWMDKSNEWDICFYAADGQPVIVKQYP